MSTGKMIALIKGIGGGSGSGGGGASLPAAAPYQQLVTDGDGKWVAADRLAYKTFEPATITWDGSTDGLESVLGKFFKVSSQVVSKDQILGQTLTLKTPGSDQTINLDDTNVSEDGNGNVVIEFFGTKGVLSIKTPFSSEGVTLSEGLWFIQPNSDAYVSGLKYLSETIHPIPDEYLPGYFKLFVVTAANDGDFENNTYTANMDRDEAMAVLQNYPFAVMKAGNKIYRLSIVVIQNDMFIMTFYDNSGEIEVTLMYNTDGTIVFFNP